MIMIINSMFYYWQYYENKIRNKEIRNLIKKHQKNKEIILIKLLLYMIQFWIYRLQNN